MEYCATVENCLHTHTHILAPRPHPNAISSLHLIMRTDPSSGSTIATTIIIQVPDDVATALKLGESRHFFAVSPTFALVLCGYAMSTTSSNSAPNINDVLFLYFFSNNRTYYLTRLHSSLTVNA